MEEEDERCASPPASGEVLCASCSKAPPKYRCPGCGVRTCSLACVKLHKSSTGCSGKRDRTAFVALQEFGDNQLLSDYSFLEDVLQQHDVAERELAAYGGSQYYMTAAMSRLRDQARNRNITLLFMANGMSRRNANTSFYHFRWRLIFWRVEWWFHRADVHISDPKVSENERLSAVLCRHLEPLPGKAATLHKLRSYVAAGMKSLRLFLRKEPGPANDVRYYELSVNEPLGRQLANKCIIEFPVIHVALESEVADFPLVGAEGTVSKKAKLATEETAGSDVRLDNPAGIPIRLMG